MQETFFGGDEETQTLKADVEKRKRQESASMFGNLQHTL